MRKQKSKTCEYCKNPQIKKRVVFEDKLVRVFPTNIPITDGHMIISTKRCVKKLQDFNDEEIFSVFKTAIRVMRILKNTHKATGFNCAWNQEKLAGQTIPHFHLHIIPRKKGDKGLLGYDPRNMLYRTGDREITSLKELLKTRDKVKKNFK